MRYKIPEEYIPAFLCSGRDAILKIQNSIFNNLKKEVPHILGEYGYIGALSIFSVWKPDIKDIKEHKEQNKKIWEEQRKQFIEDKYIEYQNRMSQIQFGNYSRFSYFLGIKNYENAIAGSDNICQVIAVYNSLSSLKNSGKLKKEYDFPDLLEKFEEKGISAEGNFGTNPMAINNFLKEEGYETKMIVGADITEDKIRYLSEEFDTYIITVYNDKDDITKKVHSMSITVNQQGKYVIHNDYNTYGKDQRDCLNDVINSYEDGNNKLIDIIGVK